MTVSLRERLEAKARRRIVVPVQVSDPGDEARRRAEQAVTARNIAGYAGLQGEKLTELDAEVEAAEAALADHSVPVELLAMPAADWEALVALIVPADESKPVDWTTGLPLALAACCVDESLRDAEWWAERLLDPAWASGDVAALRRAVISLHDWSPASYLPKG